MVGGEIMRFKKIIAALLLPAMLNGALTAVAYADDTVYHTVTFDSNGVDHDFGSLKVPDGVSLSKFDGFDKEHYYLRYNAESGSWENIIVDGKVFMDYTKTADGKGFFPMYDNITEDLTVYAEWKDISDIQPIFGVEAEYSVSVAGMTVDEFFDSIKVPDDKGYYLDKEECVVEKYDEGTDSWSQLKGDDILEKGGLYCTELDFDYDTDTKYRFVYVKNFSALLNGADAANYDEYMRFSFTAISGRLGDINGDGEVNTKDAMLAVSYAKKSSSPKTDDQKLAADVNADKQLDTKDAMKIINAAKNRTEPVSPVIRGKKQI